MVFTATGATDSFLFFAASLMDMPLLKPMTTGLEERDFKDKFELLEAMALGQMSRARAKYLIGMKNHDPRSTRLSDMLPKEQKQLRGSKEYNNLKSGIGHVYTYFWNNHDQHHHMLHLENLVCPPRQAGSVRQAWKRGGRRGGCGGRRGIGVSCAALAIEQIGDTGRSWWSLAHILTH